MMERVEVTIDGTLASSTGSTLSNSGAMLANAPEGSLPNNTTNLVIEGNFINDGVIDFNTGTVAFTGDSTTLSGTPYSTSFYSMRIDSGSTVTSVIPLTVRNTLTVSGSGTFLAGPGADATLLGNLSVTGSFRSQAMVAFPDTTTITGVGSKLFNRVQVTGVLTPNSAYTITGDLSLSGKGTLRAGNSTTTFGGITVFSNSGTGSAAFYNITIPVNPTPFSLMANADLTVIGGTLRWNNGSFLSTAETTFGRTGTTRLTGTGSVQFNTLTVNAGTTFRPNIPCTVTGNVVVNGTLIASNAITFGGSTLLATTGIPVIAFNNLAIGNGNSLTSYPGTVTINGNFTNNGTFDANGGTLAFSGSTAKKISGTSVTLFNNINVNNGTAVTDVSVESNAVMIGVLTLAANAHFDPDGSGDTSIFTIQSRGDDPTLDGSIASLPAGALVQGQVTVQRYLSIEGPNNHRIYRYISSPVLNAPVSDLQNEIPVTGTFAGPSSCQGCGTNPSMFWYDETVTAGGMNSGFTNFPSASNTEVLVPGRGYAVFVRGNINPVMGAGSAKYDLRGPIHSGTIDYLVTFTSSGVPADDGWNLVGNPYPSAIDWNAPSGWTKTNLGGSIYRLDNGLNPGRYATWNGVVGTNGGSETIASGQGFFVQAFGEAPALISDESVKVAGTPTTYFRKADPTRLLRITLSQGAMQDETVIHFRVSASRAFDPQYDAMKLKNLLNGNSNTPLLNLSTFSPQDDHPLAINSLPPGCSTSVRLDVSDVPAGFYRLDFSNMKSFPSTTQIILTDNFTDPKTEVDLHQQSTYPFQVTLDSLSFGAARFQLFFTDQRVLTLETQVADVCDGQDAVVLVTDSRPGINYFVEMSDTLPGQIGNGGSISLPINSGRLKAGINKLKVWARSLSCATIAASRQRSIHVVAVHTVRQVSSTPSCQPGAVSITADGAPADGYYLWYEQPGDLSAIPGQTSSVFVTPPLAKSKTFYVAAVNALGCEGERTAATATVINYDSAKITQVENKLQSNYELGNHWYWEGQLMTDTTASLEIGSAGQYTLEVTIDGCTSADKGTFVLTGLGRGASGRKIFPNPVSAMLSVELQNEDDQLPDPGVFNAGGEEIGRILMTPQGKKKKGQFDFSSFPAGLYFIRVGSGKSSQTMRIIKK